MFWKCSEHTHTRTHTCPCIHFFPFVLVSQVVQQPFQNQQDHGVGFLAFFRLLAPGPSAAFLFPCLPGSWVWWLTAKSTSSLVFGFLPG